MAHVRDIMNKHVVTIEQDSFVLDAARLLKEKDVSFLVIVKDGNPVGVLSERDIVRRLAAEDKQASKIRVYEIMSPKFRWVEPTTEIEDAVQKMLNNNIRRLIVLENGKLVGVITQTDLTGFLRSKLLIDETIEKIEKD
ncbi:MAG: CBS domain-containing protein [Chitinophagaceae bacterium]|nr:MAG: CBS domain-containing protein [Chitinophagaceae bacterium]